MVISVGATLAASTACGGRAEAPAGTQNCTGTESCNPPAQQVVCPSTVPSAGGACTGDGTCSYTSADGCPDDMSCTAGKWTPVAGGCNPPAMYDASAGCPAEVPNAGTPCSGTESCSYTLDGGLCVDTPITNTEVLACQGGSWTETLAQSSSCNPPAMADAGVPDSASAADAGGE
jgi:hypothetical protein